MPQKLWYVVCYDVREPRRLRAVAKHMKGYGERVQYSVFRCRLSEREVERLRWELAQKMKTEDRVLIVRLCPHCGANLAERYGKEEWPESAETFSIV